MTCRIAELQYKELVDISDGTRYGFIRDLEVDPETGTIQTVILCGKARIFGLLGRGPELVFPWAAIKRIGADLILIDGGRRIRPQ